MSGEIHYESVGTNMGLREISKKDGQNNGEDPAWVREITRTCEEKNSMLRKMGNSHEEVHNVPWEVHWERGNLRKSPETCRKITAAGEKIHREVHVEK